MNTTISIIGMSSLSPLGTDWKTILEYYKSHNHFIEKESITEQQVYLSRIKAVHQAEIETIRQESINYSHLDPTVLYAIHCARRLFKGVDSDGNIGVNIGSSRGSTVLFEKYYKNFLSGNKISPYASPMTTLGNVSSWVANDLGIQGMDFSHSVTCSTALHAVINGVAWLSSGFCDKFIAGAAEAPLTPFTVAQMQALRVLARPSSDIEYPCRAFDLDKLKNTMVLGEGSGLLTLQKGFLEKSLAQIKGVGYATEQIQHGSSISLDGKNLKKSMEMALSGFQDVDVIVMHTPGTLKGDLAEFNAIKHIFGNNLPALTTNKWKIGHTFGASGILSLEMAIMMLQTQTFFPIPYIKNQTYPDNIRKVLVNSVGFGGNAVSILLSV